MTTAELFTRCRELIERGRLPNGDVPMVVATSDASGFPAVRWVLLKEVDDRGFVFYTNQLSEKGKHLEVRPQAALAFYWPELESQLRVSGRVEEVAPAIADAYWKTRPRGSQLASFASEQSAPLASREDLVKKLEKLTREWEGKDIPRPRHWTGFRVVPSRIELWKAGEFRLHHRELFTRGEGESWSKALLNP